MKIKILTAWRGEFVGMKTDVVESFIIKDNAFIYIFNKLMHRKGFIIRLNNCIRNLRRRKDRERKYHSIRVFLSDLRYQ